MTVKKVHVVQMVLRYMPSALSAVRRLVKTHREIGMGAEIDLTQHWGDVDYWFQECGRCGHSLLDHMIWETRMVTTCAAITTEGMCSCTSFEQTKWAKEKASEYKAKMEMASA